MTDRKKEGGREGENRKQRRRKETKKGSLTMTKSLQHPGKQHHGKLVNAHWRIVTSFSKDPHWLFQNHSD